MYNMRYKIYMKLGSSIYNIRYKIYMKLRGSMYNIRLHSPFESSRAHPDSSPLLTSFARALPFRLLRLLLVSSAWRMASLALAGPWAAAIGHFSKKRSTSRSQLTGKTMRPISWNQITRKISLTRQWTQQRGLCDDCTDLKLASLQMQFPSSIPSSTH